MKMRFILLLCLILHHYIGKAQLEETENWKGYTDYKVDTTVEGFRFLGEYKNQVKEGWWKVFYNNDLITKAFYSKDYIIQKEGLNDGIYDKFYSDDIKNKQYTIRQNNSGKIFLRIEQAENNKKVGEEVWYSNYNEVSYDTSFGLKKLDDLIFVDRNNNKYSVSSSSLKISDHELIDEQVTINDEGNYILKRKKYTLFNNKMMSFQNNKLKQYIDFSPVYTMATSVERQSLLKSVRKDVFSFNDGSQENAMTYNIFIDNKPVLEGYINSDGLPVGTWNLYHFTFFDTQEQKRTAAFSASNLIEFSKLVQGDGPFINMYYFKNLPFQTSSQITNDITQEYLNKIDKAFTAIDEPYLLTKYATFTKSGSDLNLKDNLGYHLFQKLQYSNGKMMKGYLYSPDGKIYDTINLNKDEFGETITKNSVFKRYPEHPMAEAYQKQLVDGVNMVLNTATKYLEEKNKEEWKNTKCKHCSKAVDYNTTVVVDGITCGNTTYPRGGIFCSNKCRYDYEKGYCRNK